MRSVWKDGLTSLRADALAVTVTLWVVMGSIVVTQDNAHAR